MASMQKKRMTEEKAQHLTNSSGKTYVENPLIKGMRGKLESELLDLVQREAQMTNRDGFEVMAEVTHYEGARLSKLNPATMSDDRLLNSLLDARSRVKKLEAKNGRP